MFLFSGEEGGGAQLEQRMSQLPHSAAKYFQEFSHQVPWKVYKLINEPVHAVLNHVLVVLGEYWGEWYPLHIISSLLWIYIYIGCMSLIIILPLNQILDTHSAAFVLHHWTRSLTDTGKRALKTLTGTSTSGDTWQHKRNSMANFRKCEKWVQVRKRWEYSTGKFVFTSRHLLY